jgi:hypothetical protein
MSNSDRLWLTCIHVLAGAATEIIFCPSRIVICKASAIEGKEGPNLLPDDQLRLVCPVCLNERFRPVSIIRGRKHLDRDLAGGHCHDN